VGRAAIRWRTAVAIARSGADGGCQQQRAKAEQQQQLDGDADEDGRPAAMRAVVEQAEAGEQSRITSMVFRPQ
jgi:hypothetical protein